MKRKFGLAVDGDGGVYETKSRRAAFELRETFQKLLAEKDPRVEHMRNARMRVVRMTGNGENVEYVG